MLLPTVVSWMVTLPRLMVSDPLLRSPLPLACTSNLALAVTVMLMVPSVIDWFTSPELTVQVWVVVSTVISL